MEAVLTDYCTVHGEQPIVLPSLSLSLPLSLFSSLKIENRTTGLPHRRRFLLLFLPILPILLLFLFLYSPFFTVAAIRNHHQMT